MRPKALKSSLAPQALAAFNAGLQQHQQGDLSSAEASYRRALECDARCADAWHLLGVVAHQRGQHSDAHALISKALSLSLQPDYYVNLANVEQAQGRLDEAATSLQQALKLAPKSAVALAYAAAQSNLGSLLTQRGDRLAALQCHLAAVAAAPASADAQYNLANSYAANGRLLEAVLTYQQVLELRADHADAWNNLGIALGRLGSIGMAVDALRTAMQLSPANAGFHSNLIFFLDYDVRADASAQQGERQRWWQQHIAPLNLPRRQCSNVCDPQRKLRIGYVSADFWQHSAAFTFAPMLLNFNREHFEVYCYANQLRADAVTQTMQQSVTAWREIAMLDDASVAAQIQADAIDILVDLSAHSAGNRLPVFARKPAPVQITAWGHANGTGMPEMDVLFTDAVTIAASQAPLYAERLVNLPCTLTYSPQLSLPAVTTLPAELNAGITFGYFNRLSKLDDAVLAVWAKILAAIPAAKLLIKTPELSDPANQINLQARAAAAGIAAGKLILQGKTDQLAHLAAYNAVDMCLDPFPHGGGISTFESLWMGVPVITLLGQTQVGRLAAGIVSAVGLPDWVASNVDMYVAQAIARAQDLPALARLRQGLRAQVMASAAGNPAQYVQAVEAAYRSEWQRWCESK